MKKIRFGIVGPGNIAKTFARAIKIVNEAELVAVASRDKARGQAFADEFGIPNVLSSYEEMAACPDVDAVYIATPHPFHKPCAEIFLNAKKHVLCEKPVCVNADDAQKLYECSVKNGVFLMEAMWTRFLPATMKAIELVNSGEIGQVRAITADFCYNIEDMPGDKLFKNDMAGGSLLDVGVYAINFAGFFQGYDPKEITARCRVENGVDTHTAGILGYENGVTAYFTSALTVEKPENAYVYGSKGYLFIPNFYKAQRIIINKGGSERTIDAPSLGNGFEEEIIEVCRCISQGKTQSDIHPMSDSIKVLKIMDQMRKQNGIVYPADR